MIEKIKLRMKFQEKKLPTTQRKKICKEEENDWEERRNERELEENKLERLSLKMKNREQKNKNKS